MDMTPYGPVRFEAGGGGRHWWLQNVLPVGIGLLLAIGWGLLKMDSDPGAATFAIAMTVVIVVALFILTLRLNARSRIVVTDTHVVAGSLGKTRVFDRRAIAAVVAPERVAVAGQFRGSLIFLVGRDGTCLARITCSNWAPGLRDRAAEAIGAPLAQPPVLTAQDAARMPGAFPWSWRHPGLAMALGGLITVALIGLFVLVAWLVIGH